MLPDLPTLGARLAWARDKKNSLSQTELAKRLDVSQGAIEKAENGKTKKPKFLPEAAVELGVPYEWLLSNKPGQPSFADRSRTVAIGHISVIGEVQAGIWKEARQWDQQDWQSEFFNVAANETSAYGLRVVGDSMDQYYPPSSIVVVLPIHDYPLPIESFDHVIVERSRGGDIYELTIKELVIEDGKAELWPRSKNPKYKDPISLFWPYDKIQHHGIETVEIKGVVIGSINRRKRL